MGKKLIKGTIILTISGIITKIIGFYYRIFLSQNIGATGMGIYQMTLPILGLFAALSTGGLELSVSKRIAESPNDIYQTKFKLKSGIVYGLLMSFASSIIFAITIPIINKYLLNTADISMLLYMLIPAIPLMSIHSALNGYFLGCNKPHITGLSICIENLAKLLFTLFMCNAMSDIGGLTPSHCIIAITISEIASVAFIVLFNYFSKNFSHSNNTKSSEHYYIPIKQELKTYLYMAVPVSFTRIMLSLMHSIEAILIPVLLMSYGLSNDTAIGIYGILVGMSIPFILFPTAISNALSNILLPSISECISKNKLDKLNATASLALRYSMSMGIFFTGFFLIFGKTLGECFFENSLAGEYIRIFSFLCPFIYVDITLSSIINGFGLTKITCKNNLIAAGIRTLFLLIFVSNYGIVGYLWGLLAGEILSTLLNLLYVRKLCTLEYNITDYLLTPLIYTGLSITIALLTKGYLDKISFLSNTLSILVTSCISCLVFLLLIILNTKTKKV